MNLTTPFAFRAPPCEDPSYCGGPQRHEAAYHSYMNIMRQAHIAGPEELQAIIMGATRRDPHLQRQLAMDTNIFIHLGMMPSDPFIIHGGSAGGEARHGPMGGAGLQTRMGGAGPHAQMGASGPHALIGGGPHPSMVGGGFHNFSHPHGVGHHFGVQGGGFHGDPHLRGHNPFKSPHPQALGHDLAGHGGTLHQHEDPRLRGHAHPGQLQPGPLIPPPVGQNGYHY